MTRLERIRASWRPEEGQDYEDVAWLLETVDEIKKTLEFISHGHTIPGYKGENADPIVAIAQEVIHGAQTKAKEALARLSEPDYEAGHRCGEADAARESLAPFLALATVVKSAHVAECEGKRRAGLESHPCPICDAYAAVQRSGTEGGMMGELWPLTREGFCHGCQKFATLVLVAAGIYRCGACSTRKP